MLRNISPWKFYVLLTDPFTVNCISDKYHYLFIASFVELTV